MSETRGEASLSRGGPGAAAGSTREPGGRQRAVAREQREPRGPTRPGGCAVTTRFPYDLTRSPCLGPATGRTRHLTLGERNTGRATRVVRRAPGPRRAVGSYVFGESSGASKLHEEFRPSCSGRRISTVQVGPRSAALTGQRVRHQTLSSAEPTWPASPGSQPECRRCRVAVPAGPRLANAEPACQLRLGAIPPNT